VARKGDKTETVAVKLAAMPGTGKDDGHELPENVPDVASAKKAQEPLEQGAKKIDVNKIKKEEAPKKEEKEAPKKEEVETGLLKLTTANGNQSYYVHVHENYDPNVAQALLVWLHPPGKNQEADIQALTGAWNELCKDRHILIVAPLTDSENGWVPSDSRAVQEVIRDVLGRYTVDENRIVAHGMGVGGQMAIYLGFHARDLVRGVATTGAVATGVKDNTPNQRLAFFLVAGDRDPLAKAIAECVADLRQHKLPVLYREIMGQGRQYLTEEVLGELVRWIDILDRL
jgi:predicted peptidase